MAVWPVGVLILFVCVVQPCRDSILAGKSTPLTRATHFLTNDYQPHVYFWEALELARRTSNSSAAFESMRLRPCCLLLRSARARARLWLIERASHPCDSPDGLAAAARREPPAHTSHARDLR